jgi:hypothetical protein
MQIRVGGWLVNKRKQATTSGDPLPAIPHAPYPDAKAQQADPNILLPLPANGFEPQKHINMCGEACVAMLYKYHGADAGIDMSRNPRGIMEGSDDVALANRFPRIQWWKYKQKMTRYRLAYGLTTHGPLIASGDFARFMGKRWGHFILVNGIIDNVVHIADPWHGEDRRKPFDWFAEKLASEYLLYFE